MDQPPDSPQNDGSLAPQAPAPLGPSPAVREVFYRAFVLLVVIIAGMLVILFVAASAGSALLAAVAAGSAPAASTATPAATPAVVAEVSLPPTTEPVEMLPENLAVAVAVGPKNSAGVVTVSFLGGPGKAQVKQVEVRLIRSDGTVETGTMDPKADFPQVDLQGTKETDRIEVFARMLSGKTYKILDQPVFYLRRN